MAQIGITEFEELIARLRDNLTQLGGPVTVHGDREQRCYLQGLIDALGPFETRLAVEETAALKAEAERAEEKKERDPFAFPPNTMTFEDGTDMFKDDES